METVARVRKTYQEKLRPTPAQERELERVLERCRTLYNAALEQRITLWRQRGVSVSRSQQEAELKTLRAEMPEYGALHSHVLQDVLARLEKTYQAFFRRVQNGEKHLKKAQKRVSRRKKGSHRRAKAAQQCAKKHQHVRRQRRDFHHKTALALVRQYDVISVEAIQPANLSRRPAPAPRPDENGTGGYAHNGASRKAGLNTSIHDAGWRHFLSLLAYKAACAGKRVEAVNPAYTSQEWSGCGARIQKSLSVRTHVCTRCGLILDRDENAARNILWRGQRLRGLAGLPAGMNREPAGL